MGNIIRQIFLGVLVIIGMNGCLSFEQELQRMLTQHNIHKKMYIRNDVIGFDSYEKNKKVLHFLNRGEQYNIIDIKNGYARFKKLTNNKLQNDVWVQIEALEVQPTYFLQLTTNAHNPKIIVAGQEYESNMRLPKGNYKVEIYADTFLTKILDIKIEKDTTKNINLDFDIEAEKKRRGVEKAKAIEKAKREKIIQEIQKSIYLDKQQKLIWQDNNDVIKIQKPWITKINYDIKNYNDTSGDTATTYCKNLNLAGFNDWRLPTKDELKKLYNQKVFLKNVNSNWYWSSTYNENISNRTWGIYFNNGDGYSDLKSSINYVRCVRK